MLVAELDQAGIHTVKVLRPEFFNEVGGGLVFAGDGEGGTENMLGDNLDDATGEGVETPGVEALLEEFFAGVLVAVEFGGVEGGGPNQELVFRFRESMAFWCLGAEERGKTGKEGGVFWHGIMLAGIGPA